MPSLAKLQFPAFIMENQQPVLGRHYFYTDFVYLYVSFYPVISLSQIEFQQYGHMGDQHLFGPTTTKLAEQCHV